MDDDDDDDHDDDIDDDHDDYEDDNKPVFIGELLQVCFAIDPCHGRCAAEWLRGSAP